MLRLATLLLVMAMLGAFFAPPRLRVVFWGIAAAALIYTLLRLAGIVPGPEPTFVGYLDTTT